MSVLSKVNGGRGTLLTALTAVVAAIGLTVAVPVPAQAGSYSFMPYTSPVSYTVNGQTITTYVTVQVEGIYNQTADTAQFSCTAESPTAVFSTVTCYQGKGVGNPITAGNLGSAVVAGPVITAGRTSSICFVTEFVYPGTSERGQRTACSSPETYPEPTG